MQVNFDFPSSLNPLVGSAAPCAPASRLPARRGLPALPLALAVLVTFATQFVRADDWPQWLGPQRDGVWRETGILEKFPEAGPKLRWRTPIGAGYAGPSVAKGRVFIHDRVLKASDPSRKNTSQRGIIQGVERVLCLNEADGKILWQHEYDCPYDLAYAAGPRATPTVDGNRVFTFGAEANLMCFDTVSGKVLWSRELKKDYNARTPMWGFAGQLLVDGQKLICLVGGENSVAVALDKGTGKELWRALSAKEPGYTAPMIYDAGGQRQLIIWHPESLNSLNPETGKVHWSEPFTVRSGLTAPTPRKDGDKLLITAFYNGPMLMKLDATKPAASVVWRGTSNSERNTDKLHSIIATPFIEGGHIYGVCSYGQLRCLRLDTGERVWETLAATTGGKEDRWATTFIVKHGNRFFLPNENGDLIIARLTPKGYDEVGRFHMLEPTNTDPRREVVWSHPAFANRSIYARNDKEIVCYSLAVE
jgi:outer membrane protein assembly factor BamB